VPLAPIVAAAGLAPGRARVRHYPCDHFDTLGAGEWFGAAADHQTQFLAGVLSAAPVPA
jgi:hypothetical protein